MRRAVPPPCPVPRSTSRKSTSLEPRSYPGEVGGVTGLPVVLHTLGLIDTAMLGSWRWKGSPQEQARIAAAVDQPAQAAGQPPGVVDLSTFAVTHTHDVPAVLPGEGEGAAGGPCRRRCLLGGLHRRDRPRPLGPVGRRGRGVAGERDRPAGEPGQHGHGPAGHRGMPTRSCPLCGGAGLRARRRRQRGGLRWPGSGRAAPGPTRPPAEGDGRSTAALATTGLATTPANSATASLTHDSQPQVPADNPGITPIQPHSPGLDTDFGKMPIRFEPNIGQGHSDGPTDVSLMAKGQGVSLFLGGASMTLCWPVPATATGSRPRATRCGLGWWGGPQCGGRREPAGQSQPLLPGQ